MRRTKGNFEVHREEIIENHDQISLLHSSLQYWTPFCLTKLTLLLHSLYGQHSGFNNNRNVICLSSFTEEPCDCLVRSYSRTVSV